VRASADIFARECEIAAIKETIAGVLLDPESSTLITYVSVKGETGFSATGGIMSNTLEPHRVRAWRNSATEKESPGVDTADAVYLIEADPLDREAASPRRGDYIVDGNNEHAVLSVEAGEIGPNRTHYVCRTQYRGEVLKVLS